MKDLIILKRNFFLLKDYDDFLDNNQYHESLQTLESEVRNHIKIQQQLKLFIDTQQSKLEEMEKKSENLDPDVVNQIRILEKENIELSVSLKAKENEIKSLKNSSEINLKEEILKLKQMSQRDSERIYELEQKTKQLTNSWIEIESSLEKQKLMCVSVQQENERLKFFMKNKSAEKHKTRNKLLPNPSKNNLNDLQVKNNINRSLSPTFPIQQTLTMSKSNINLRSKKALIRDVSMEKIQTERQLTSKRKY